MLLLRVPNRSTVSLISSPFCNHFSLGEDKFSSNRHPVEHVPDPSKLILSCVQLLKPKGQLFLSTLNRNPRSFITAILGAEYIFNILPKGTHEWNKFIKPSELEKYMRLAGVKLVESKGMSYNPILHTANLNDDLGVNYIMHGTKNA